MQAIWEIIGWSQGDPDVAHQLVSPDLRRKAWVLGGVGVFRAFREKSLALLRDGTSSSYVVVADITGFYDNIDIGKLLSDLRGAGAPAADVELLGRCLRTWAGPRNRGIPQGYTASDILAKLFISSVDRSLRNDEIVHLRYVDDVRIFCASKREARVAIRKLYDLLHPRGLDLQTAKTKIKSRVDAQREFGGVGEVLANLTTELAREMHLVADDSEYATSDQLFEVLRSRTGPPSAILERAFRENFSISESDSFDKSLFHYLLGRLAATGSKVAVPYCLEALQTRPEETGSILRYFSDLDLELPELNSLTQYMESIEAIYDYQLYQLLRWFTEGRLHSERVLRLARRWAFDRNRDPWLRDYSISYLGMFGEQSDLDAIEGRYLELASELEKATYVAALQRMEVSRRNAFYSRASGDGPLVERAIELAKGKHVGAR
ncbi:MAG: RNA-directed DNA polymerase [Myxococcota bacterium]